MLFFDQLEVGKLYNTIRQRTYPRSVFSQPLCEDICGEIQPEDAFVVLGLKNVVRLNHDFKWIKLLTTKGIIGWTLFIESFDKEPSFVELKP